MVSRKSVKAIPLVTGVRPLLPSNRLRRALNGCHGDVTMYRTQEARSGPGLTGYKLPERASKPFSRLAGTSGSVSPLIGSGELIGSFRYR